MLTVLGGILLRLGILLLPVFGEVPSLAVVLGTLCLLLYRAAAILTFFAVFDRILAVDVVIQAGGLLLAPFVPLQKNV